MTNAQIKEYAKKYNDYVVECRRKIHAFAEVAGTEVKTSALIQSEVEALGLSWERAGDTGLVATFDTGKHGAHIALRADIDALPMPENPNNLKGPRVCMSDTPDKTCHACGHDAHTAMLLGVMKAIVDDKANQTGIIYFCFEEGEEVWLGIAGMLEVLSKYKIDTVWGIHVYAALESGKICVDAGPRMAGVASIDINVIGKGGHGSRPDLSINPVYCAANILNNVAVAWANQITAGETVTLGVTSIQGGTAGNIFPDTAHIIGSMRYFNMEEGAKAVDIFKSVAEHTAAMHKCKVEFGPKMIATSGAVINDDEYSALAKSALAEVLPDGAVTPCEPWYASESFSRYRNIAPSVFAHLGIKNDSYGSGAEHHNTYFDVDENIMPIGMMSTLKYVSAVQAKFAK